MPSPRIKKADRENLLIKLRDGHDVESAAEALGLSEGQIGVAKGKYGAEIAAAFKIGTARLRDRIMETALADDNPAIMLKLLEQREKQTDNEDPIILVERVIVQASCPHCGHTPGLKNINKPPVKTAEKIAPVEVGI